MKKDKKIIPGTEGKYAATPDGTIYNVSYTTLKWLPIRARVSSRYTNYRHFVEIKGKRGIVGPYWIDVLIAKTFLEAYDKTKPVKHIDADPHNNKITNLYQ